MTANEMFASLTPQRSNFSQKMTLRQSLSNPIRQSHSMFNNTTLVTRPTATVSFEQKARCNHYWNVLFREMDALSDPEVSQVKEDNPLLDFVHGHRRLDDYLTALRERPE